MLKRKIYADLLKWKNEHEQSCLLIKGARQVGKTFIIEDFCRNNYDNYVPINFYEDKNYSQIFDGSLKVDDLIEKISVYVPGANVIPNKTAIFLDEIQECPNAITALKFLAIDGRFDVIASGSLLGINYKENSDLPSYPVGYVNLLEMHSLDFEEFCWANGMSEDSFNNIKKYYDNKKEIPAAIHDKMLEFFKKYIIVGGMPAVVSLFVNSHDFGKVLEKQKEIVDLYRFDIGKYAKPIERAKIRECFDSVPKHLAEENKKFRYSLVSKGGKAEKYQSSLQWLYDANIINFCYNLSKPELPLEGNAKSDVFKLYMRDTGLLMSMLEEGSQKEVFDGNLGIYKGALYENIIADILTKKNMKLYYFEYNSTLEIDFFIRYNNIVTALEIKSGNNTKSKSLQSVMSNWGVEQAIRLSTKNIGESETGILSLPLYMAIFL